MEELTFEEWQRRIAQEFRDTYGDLVEPLPRQDLLGVIEPPTGGGEDGSDLGDR
jgi:hypothetical protein